MRNRHDIVGIKQTIRLEWVQKATNLIMAGLDASCIRQELSDYMADKGGSGSLESRGRTSRDQVVNMLMTIWISPDRELTSFRDVALAFLREHPAMALGIHWGMISAAYPFWYNTARQTGRLLALQDQVTQTQVIDRLREQYGDRQTVSRYARAVIRSFVAWGVLKESRVQGCYEKSASVHIDELDLAVFMFESALRAIPEARASLGLLSHNPAFFPFQLPAISGNVVSRSSDRIDVERYGLDDVTLSVK